MELKSLEDIDGSAPSPRNYLTRVSAFLGEGKHSQAKRIAETALVTFGRDPTPSFAVRSTGHQEITASLFELLLHVIFVDSEHHRGTGCGTRMGGAAACGVKQAQLGTAFQVDSTCPSARRASWTDAGVEIQHLPSTGFTRSSSDTALPPVRVMDLTPATVAADGLSEGTPPPQIEELPALRERLLGLVVQVATPDADFLTAARTALADYVKAVMDVADIARWPTFFDNQHFVQVPQAAQHFQSLRKGLHQSATTHAEIFGHPFERLALEVELLESLLAAELKVSLLRGADAFAQLLRAERLLLRFVGTRFDLQDANGIAELRKMADPLPSQDSSGIAELRNIFERQLSGASATSLSVNSTPLMSRDNSLGCPMPLPPPIVQGVDMTYREMYQRWRQEGGPHLRFNSRASKPNGGNSAQGLREAVSVLFGGRGAASLPSFQGLDLNQLSPHSSINSMAEWRLELARAPVAFASPARVVPNTFEVTNLERRYVTLYDHCHGKLAIVCGAGFEGARHLGPHRFGGRSPSLLTTATLPEIGPTQLPPPVLAPPTRCYGACDYLGSLETFAALPGVLCVGVFANVAQLPHVPLAAAHACVRACYGCGVLRSEDRLATAFKDVAWFTPSGMHTPKETSEKEGHFQAMGGVWSADNAHSKARISSNEAGGSAALLSQGADVAGGAEEIEWWALAFKSAAQRGWPDHTDSRPQCRGSIATTADSLTSSANGVGASDVAMFVPHLGSSCSSRAAAIHSPLAAAAPALLSGEAALDAWRADPLLSELLSLLSKTCLSRHSADLFPKQEKRSSTHGSSGNPAVAAPPQPPLARRERASQRSWQTPLSPSMPTLPSAVVAGGGDGGSLGSSLAPASVLGPAIQPQALATASTPSVPSCSCWVLPLDVGFFPAPLFIGAVVQTLESKCNVLAAQSIISGGSMESENSSLTEHSHRALRAFNCIRPRAGNGGCGQSGWLASFLRRITGYNSSSNSLSVEPSSLVPAVAASLDTPQRPTVSSGSFDLKARFQDLALTMAGRHLRNGLEVAW